MRCLLSSRIAFGLSTVKFGKFRKGKEDSKTATLDDRIPVSLEEMENHYLSNDDVEHAGRYPFSIDFFKRSIRDRNLISAMVYGAENYPGREEALEFLTPVTRRAGVFYYPIWKPYGEGRQ